MAPSIKCRGILKTPDNQNYYLLREMFPQRKFPISARQVFDDENNAARVLPVKWRDEIVCVISRGLWMTWIRNTNPPWLRQFVCFMTSPAADSRRALCDAFVAENSTCRRNKTNGGVSVRRINNSSCWIKKKKRTLFRSRRGLISPPLELSTYWFCNIYEISAKRSYTYDWMTNNYDWNS